MDEVAEELSVDEDFQNMKVNYGKREIEIKMCPTPLAEGIAKRYITVLKIYFLFASEIFPWCKGRTYVMGKSYYHSGYEITKEQFMKEMGIRNDLQTQGISEGGLKNGRCS